ncbi:MAG: threonylcarbamoyl-AMP synthase, partial [Chlorobiales bacterium]|nr:threonylcarbamoyl-AMP synthase [Chlorobiales bacterium]
MQTVVTESVAVAAAWLNRGEAVAFPTETVYGLGADIFNDEAIRKIFAAKGRPSDNPLIVHIHSPEQIHEVASELPETADIFIRHFFPGPLTLILKKNKAVSSFVTAGLPTVGIRCPSHPVATEFLKRCSHPVAAPSANISGRPSSTDWKAVYDDLKGKIRCVLKGPQSTIGLESTIVDCSETPPRLLRSGAVSLESLRKYVPETIAAATQTHQQPKSPGLKYPHYSPSAQVKLCGPGFPGCKEAKKSAWIGLSAPPEGVTKIAVCQDPEEYAYKLFSFFRECDRENIEVIFCEMPPEEGIGRAIRDRL